METRREPVTGYRLFSNVRKKVDHKQRILNAEYNELVEQIYTISKDLVDFVVLLVDEGLTFNQIGKELIYRKYAHPQNKYWNPGAVKAFYKKNKK